MPASQRRRPLHSFLHTRATCDLDTMSLFRGGRALDIGCAVGQTRDVTGHQSKMKWEDMKDDIHMSFGVK